MAEVSVRRADITELEGVSALFDLYRQFYKKNSAPEAARSFLQERMLNHESVIFSAVVDKGEIVGFTQLYPGFTSLGLGRTWILNDLYVAESYRRQGIAEKLMLAAHEHAKQTNARAIILETQVENRRAQALYEKLGYSVEEGFFVYSLPIK